MLKKKAKAIFSRKWGLQIVDNTKKPPSVLSICTGYGGIEIGLGKAIGPVSPVAYVEVEAFADTNLVAKMEQNAMVPAPVFTDLKTFRPYVFRGKVDILTAGYPCQPFSAAGRRHGKKDPRHLWPWIRDAIAAIRPGICFFENVEGHISLGLREVLTDLAKLGYRVESDSGEPTWGLFSAAECGAPHQRKRVFILAYRERAEWRPNIQGAYFQDRHDAGRAEKTNRVRALCPGLGNSPGNNQRRSSVSAVYRERIAPGRSGCNVADPGSAELNRVSEPEERWEDRAVGVAGLGLADSERRRGKQSVQNISAEFIHRGWPARPGEPQHGWEELRILAYTPQQLQYRGWGTRPPGRGEFTDQGEREIKPGMGRAINGTQNRVDRLRLLGNGVVPATAEKAFLTLLNRIENPHRERPQIQIQMDLFPAASNYI